MAIQGMKQDNPNKEENDIISLYRSESPSIRSSEGLVPCMAPTGISRAELIHRRGSPYELRRPRLRPTSPLGFQSGDINYRSISSGDQSHIASMTLNHPVAFRPYTRPGTISPVPATLERNESPAQGRQALQSVLLNRATSVTTVNGSSASRPTTSRSASATSIVNLYGRASPPPTNDVQKENQKTSFAANVDGGTEESGNADILASQSSAGKDGSSQLGRNMDTSTTLGDFVAASHDQPRRYQFPGNGNQQPNRRFIPRSPGLNNIHSFVDALTARKTARKEIQDAKDAGREPKPGVEVKTMRQFSKDLGYAHLHEFFEEDGTFKNYDWQRAAEEDDDNESDAGCHHFSRNETSLNNGLPPLLIDRIQLSPKKQPMKLKIDTSVGRGKSVQTLPPASHGSYVWTAQPVSPIKEETTESNLMKPLSPVPTAVNEGKGLVSETSPKRPVSSPSKHVGGRGQSTIPEEGDGGGKGLLRATSCPPQLYAERLKAARDDTLPVNPFHPFRQTHGEGQSSSPSSQLIPYSESCDTVRRYVEAADPAAVAEIMNEPPQDLFSTREPTVSKIFGTNKPGGKLSNSAGTRTYAEVRIRMPAASKYEEDRHHHPHHHSRGEQEESDSPGTTEGGGGGEQKSFFSVSSKRSSSIRKSLRRRLSNIFGGGGGGRRQHYLFNISGLETDSPTCSALDQQHCRGSLESVRSRAPILGSSCGASGSDDAAVAVTATGRSPIHLRRSIRKRLSRWAKGVGRVVSGRENSRE